MQPCASSGHRIGNGVVWRWPRYHQLAEQMGAKAEDRQIVGGQLLLGSLPTEHVRQASEARSGQAPVEDQNSSQLSERAPPPTATFGLGAACLLEADEDGLAIALAACRNGAV